MLARLWFGREMPLLQSSLRARVTDAAALLCDWADEAV
jgi:hypothetical protein